MIVSLIVAVDKEYGIGIENKLPWDRIKEDMEFFRNTTLNHTVIMGRRTFESMGNKPLPKRKNIVLTHNASLHKCDDSLIYLSSLENAISFELLNSSREIFIIGGESIYKEAMKYADRLYITHIPDKFNCDRYFPVVDENVFKKKEKIKSINYNGNRECDIFMYYNY